MQNMLLDIHVFPHDAHRQPPRMRAADTQRPRRQEASDAKAGSCREQKAAAGGELPSTRQTPTAAAARIYAKRARRAFRQAGRPSYPDYDRRRVEDFAARTRWMPSAVARHSFASCPPLSPNTGVHTTHNARRIFEAIVWRYVRSARFIMVPPPPCKRPSSSPKRCRLPRVLRSPISPPTLAGGMCRSR